MIILLHEGVVDVRRKILKELDDWRLRTSRRLPVVVIGARQVGKTHALQTFAKEKYRNSVYINFELDQGAAEYFQQDLQPQRIIRLLEAASGQRIIPGETLIIFDEIQMCSRALTSLKYFAELAPEYHLAAAGSLLGLTMRQSDFYQGGGQDASSHPVGKIKRLEMFPLDFEEFLWAMGKEAMADLIKEHYQSQAPFPLHQAALEYYRQYLCLGGMPAVIIEFLAGGSYLEAEEVQRDIVKDYLADMMKHVATTADPLRIRNVFSSIPAQLGKENAKFMYKYIGKNNVNERHYGEAIQWLCDSGIALKCRRTEHGAVSPDQIDPKAFKLYMCDTGILLSQTNIQPSTLLVPGEGMNEYKGYITENYLAQALQSAGHSLLYWESKAGAEVDFLVDTQDGIIPLEVKSATNVKAKSLINYMQKYGPAYAYRVSGRNFDYANGIKSVPLYATFLIKIMDLKMWGR